MVWLYRSRCVLVLAQQFTLVALGLAILGISGLGIDFIRSRVDPTLSSSPWLMEIGPPSDWSDLTVLIAIATVVLSLAFLHACLKYFAAISAARLAQTIVVDLRSQVYDKLQRLSFRYYNNNSSSSVINRVAGDVQAVRMFVDGVTIEIITVFVSLLIYTAYMLSIHVPLTLACLATTPLLWCLAIRFSRIIKPKYLKTRKLIDEMVRNLVENVQGVAVVKGFGQEDEQIGRFRESSERIRQKRHEIFQKICIFQPSIGMLTQVNRAVLLGYGGYLTVTEHLPLGVGLVAFAGLLQHFSAQVGQVTNITNRIQTSLAGAERVFEVLDTPIEIYSPTRPRRLKRAIGSIRFEQLSFSYEPGLPPVLSDIDLTIEPGESVAIVGPTGAGKTTLLSLIPRLYDATAGSLTIDGTDVRDFELQDLRRNVGFVFQESFLFSHTAAANIAFGNPLADADQIAHAARLAAADRFISHLPKGYDTLIGEHGSNLSGGERQRLAMARALLLDPSILIFDDPTAAVDPETEREILATISEAARSRTTLVVAHRLSTIRRVDRVVVLSKGRIVQTGSPERLLHQDGLFQNLFALQLADENRHNGQIHVGA